jgi:hypothetical protein
MPSGGFGPKTVAALIRLVGKCPQLHHLQLVGFGPTAVGATNFGDAGAKALAAQLPGRRRLEKVILTGCDIREEGVLALADALRLARSMVELDLSWNGPVGKDAAYALKVSRQNDITIWLPAVESKVENVLDSEILKCMEPTYDMLVTQPKRALREKAHGHVDRGRMPHMGQLLYTQEEARQRAFQKATELIERGGDPNLRGKFDETLLHYAASTGDPTAVPRLIELGANLTLTNQFEEGVRESETPLEVCLKKRKGAWKAVARLLITAGCTIRRSKVLPPDSSDEDVSLKELLGLIAES